MEEIYRDLNSPKRKEFEKLLNNEFSKTQISEGKISEGTITKITNKLVFIELPGAKSEGTLDINEMKLLKEEGNLQIGSKISQPNIDFLSVGRRTCSDFCQYHSNRKLKFLATKNPILCALL